MKIENAIPILTADGFEEIGKVSYGGITAHHFWNPSSSIEACIAQTCGGEPLLLKCQMHYFLKNVQDGKEILGRDLEPFIRACEATFASRSTCTLVGQHKREKDEYPNGTADRQRKRALLTPERAQA